MSSLPPSSLLPASFRTARPQQLAEALRDARRHTLALFDCFAAAGMDVSSRVPLLRSVNPPLWELGRIAWFAEWFILREAASSHPADAVYNSLLTRGDDLFDAVNVPHRGRWTLELPSTGGVKTYCHEVLDRVLDKLSREAGVDAALYPYRLALAHEDLRAEALLAMLQTLGLEAPPGAAGELSAPVRLPPSVDIAFAGGTLQMGSADGPGFVFDNERGQHPSHVAPFRMASLAVSNAQYLDFVEDGGYQDRRFWSLAGLAWLMRQERSAPRDWVRDGARWHTVRFGQPVMLPAGEPVRHVCLYEAQAYCAWAERRLPSEAEWEYAALSGHAAFHWGQLWEWTASPFEAYPGFVAGPWRDYSAPHFSSHQVLRGASFATPARLASTTFRHFELPERDDIFAGFRTCAF
jgi:ergothioneine biosynthesis protein EgtB